MNAKDGTVLIRFCLIINNGTFICYSDNVLKLFDIIERYQSNEWVIKRIGV